MRLKKIYFTVVNSVLMSVILLCSGVSFAETDNPDGTVAENISKACVFNRDNKNRPTYCVNDGKQDTVTELAPGERLTVTAKKDIPLGWLNLRYWGAPASVVRVTQFDGDGEIVAETTKAVIRLCEAMKLESACYKVEIVSDGALAFTDIEVYTQGALPDTAVTFGYEVKKCDFLIITTHPDDEWLFLGGIYPIWGAEKGYTGTYAYLTTPNYIRLQEALNGLYVGGVDTYPFFLGFPDVDRSASDEVKATFDRDEITLSLVRLYRRIQPVVVITQDAVNGEYGHWQHIVGANAALEAVTLAADASYDPESAELYGVWSVSKLYQHNATNNQILIDVTEPLTAYGGKTALEVSKLAYKQHKTQQQYSFYPTVKEGSYGDLRKFGLVYSTVGEDTSNDIFEHIDISQTTLYKPEE